MLLHARFCTDEHNFVLFKWLVQNYPTNHIRLLVTQSIHAHEQKILVNLFASEAV